MALDLIVNWLAVIVAAVVGFIVSFVWWGPLFGGKWAAYMGYTEKDMKKAKEKGGMGGKMVIAFIAQLIMAWILAVLIAATGSVVMMSVLLLAFWIWLGFVATIGVGVVLWNEKPWGFFWLNSIGWLVTLLVMAIVLGLF